MSLPARVLRTIRSHDMFVRGARVLVALSGGPDSVALLYVLRALEHRGELTVAGVAHFNHQLRGTAADEDEQFCRALAAALGVPIEVDRADVAALAKAAHRSMEDMARTVRYEFLRRAAHTLRADVIAVGHTLDDQAETFLLRLIRGAGGRGLAGIRPISGTVIRPLLDVSRADVRGFLAGHALPFREDQSNGDTSIPRNRVRHELIPVLQEYSPGISRVLAREAELARQDEEYLSAAAIEVARSIVLIEKGAVTIDADAAGRLPRALSSRVLRQAVQQVAPDRAGQVGFQHIDALVELAGDCDGKSVSLPGVTAMKRGGRLVIGRSQTRAPEPFSNSSRVLLSIPGEVTLFGWAISAARPPIATEPPCRSGRSGTAIVAADPLRHPLAVRARRPGDRFRPLGMGGKGRKLQDFLVDRKVARPERDQLPLVVDSEDRIVWVVGQSVAEDFRVTAPGQAVILLTARRLGGVR